MHTTLRRLIDIATVVADATAGLYDPARDRRHAEEAHNADEEEDDVVPVAGVGDVARILQFGDGGVRPAAKFAGYLRPYECLTKSMCACILGCSFASPQLVCPELACGQLVRRRLRGMSLFQPLLHGRRFLSADGLKMNQIDRMSPCVLS